MPNIPVHQPDLTTEAALHLLVAGRMEEVHGLLPWGSNYAFLVNVLHGQTEALAVYKPSAGEQPLWDFPDGTLYLRERAAFLVSEALGWGIVPPTVVREGPHGEGSVQLYVVHDPDENYFTFGDRLREQIRRIALFDEIINNADRKAGHCLLDEHGHIWAIDHGVCFNAQPKLRTVIWDFAGQPVAKHLLADIRRLCVELEEGSPLRDELSELLNERELAALRQRVNRVLTTGHFTRPGSGRSFPWPPV